MKNLRMKRVAWYLLLGLASLFVGAGGLRGQSNLVLFISPPGDYIGMGQTFVTTNISEFFVSGAPDKVTVGAFGFGFTFAGPGGESLSVGMYAGAAQYPFNGSQPGLDISGNGRGCNTECGSFQIKEIHSDENGQVDRFWAVFTNSCECFMADMTGEIRYHSLLAPANPVPQTLRVPADFPTIQAAINSSSLLASDTILVAPGTYTNALNFSGHPARLLSQAGPASTFIHVSDTENAVTFSSGETSNAFVSGFTITGGKGVFVASSSPAISSNILENCGVGIDCNFASPIVRGNSVINCSGNAISIGGASAPLIEGNIIRTNNTAIYMFAAGSPAIRNNLMQGSRSDAIGMVNQSDADIVQNVICDNAGNGINWLVPWGARGPLVLNNTIVNNGGSGIAADGFDAGAQIVNNIIVGAAGIWVGSMNDHNPPLIRHNDVYAPAGGVYSGEISDLTGIDGNISTNPRFACEPEGDFHLLATSPCIDGGTNDLTELPGLDFEGDLRSMPGAQSLAVVDMGAFEFNPIAPPTPCMYIICPSNLVVVAEPGQNSAIVNFPEPTGTPVAAFSSEPASGSVFPGGTNVVTCTATYGTNKISGTFTITVVLPVSITSQPVGTNVLAGHACNLSVTTAGTPPFTYRWLFENRDIAGATNQALALDNPQAANEGVYRVMVGNYAGEVSSDSVVVRVSPSAPLIAKQPGSQTVAAASDVVFEIAMLGSSPLRYQWYFQNAILIGATNSRCVLTNAQSGNAGDYWVVAENVLGVVTSKVASLAVTPQAPRFVVQPAGAVLSAGSSLALTGLAAGSWPIAYQWQRDGANLTGATQSVLAVEHVTQGDSGAYVLIASNAAGVATSARAQLTVNLNPVFIQGLSNQVADIGNTVALSVVSLGASPLVYAWKYNGQILNATGPSLMLTNVQPSQSGFYQVTASNAFGTAVSSARLSVLGWPSSVIAWGDNSGGQGNVPAGLTDIVAAAGGDYHSVVLHHDGTLQAWGYDGDSQCQVPTNKLRFVAVASGGGHNLAITENGGLLAWGRNEASQCVVPLAVSNGVLSVAAGDAHSLAILASGKVIAWGDNSLGQTTVPGVVNKPRAIAAGRNHNLALLTNGSVVGWGFNSHGQATAPAFSNAVAVAAGYLHSAALLANGQVVAWGDNTCGQTNVPNSLTQAVAIVTGDFHTVALQADGTVVSWGNDNFGQTDVPGGLAGVWNLACGNYHALALMKSNGSLKAWLDAGHLVIQWNSPGKLQSASTPLGPFLDLDLPLNSNSYTNFDLSDTTKFYRLR